ncbi:hypothetical protein BC940DRAFT_359422 [Gongronella butleri]|nr:hypothetical protein BC940DRAFT_359422 [Gongronella butleri]
MMEMLSPDMLEHLTPRERTLYLSLLHLNLRHSHQESTILHLMQSQGAQDMSVLEPALAANASAAAPATDAPAPQDAIQGEVQLLRTILTDQQQQLTDLRQKVEQYQELLMQQQQLVADQRVALEQVNQQLSDHRRLQTNQQYVIDRQRTILDDQVNAIQTQLQALLAVPGWQGVQQAPPQQQQVPPQQPPTAAIVVDSSGNNSSPASAVSPPPSPPDSPFSSGGYVASVSEASDGAGSLTVHMHLLTTSDEADSSPVNVNDASEANQAATESNSDVPPAQPSNHIADDQEEDQLWGEYLENSNHGSHPQASIDTNAAEIADDASHFPAPSSTTTHNISTMLLPRLDMSALRIDTNVATQRRLSIELPTDNQGYITPGADVPRRYRDGAFNWFEEPLRAETATTAPTASTSRPYPVARRRRHSEVPDDTDEEIDQAVAQRRRRRRLNEQGESKFT